MPGVQGYSHVVLETSPVQPAALAIYQNMGFKITGQYYFHLSARLMALTFV